MEALKKDTLDIFNQKFNSQPETMSMAPGRLELLGNHTDYNMGYVLGFAIDRYICATAKKTNDNKISIYSAEFDQKETFSVDEIIKNPDAKWANYIKGVIEEFLKLGIKINGFNMVVKSTIPLGSGLSSSAALLLATALCIKKMFSVKMDKMELAKLAHRAEHANNGLLDHFCSAFGKENHVLFLDCKTLEYEITPVRAKNLVVAVSHSNVRHSILEGEYQSRRKECTKATKFFNKISSNVKSLRNVNMDTLLKHKESMPHILFSRAMHIIGENERVLLGKVLLKKGRLKEFGKLLYKSHESSKIYFENSCPELDALVVIASAINGVYGSRLTGGGFGGCTLAFVNEANADDFKSETLNRYKLATGKETDVFFCKISGGAHIVF